MSITANIAEIKAEYARLKYMASLFHITAQLEDSLFSCPDDICFITTTYNLETNSFGIRCHEDPSDFTLYFDIGKEGQCILKSIDTLRHVEADHVIWTIARLSVCADRKNTKLGQFIGLTEKDQIIIDAAKRMAQLNYYDF